MHAAGVYNEDSQMEDSNISPHAGKTIMMRILGPVTTFVNRPWKVVIVML